MKEIYIVNMDVEPEFVKKGLLVVSKEEERRSLQAYQAALTSLGFDTFFPMIGLFREHEFYGNLLYATDGTLQKVALPIIQGHIEGKPLSATIDAAVSGKHRKIKATPLIVEFSDDPLYEEVFEELSGQYTIQRFKAITSHTQDNR